jgi:hypothetical protein
LSIEYVVVSAEVEVLVIVDDLEGLEVDVCYFEVFPGAVLGMYGGSGEATLVVPELDDCPANVVGEQAVIRRR